MPRTAIMMTFGLKSTRFNPTHWKWAEARWMRTWLCGNVARCGPRFERLAVEGLVFDLINED
jgi:hypothetical protein